MDGDGFRVSAIEQVANGGEVEHFLTMDGAEEMLAELGRLPIVEERGRLEQAHTPFLIEQLCGLLKKKVRSLPIGQRTSNPR